MGSWEHTKTGLLRGFIGKIDAPLDAKLKSVKWGECELHDLFNHIEQGSRLKKSDHKPGNIPFVMSGITNQGVVGYVANPAASFPGNSITIDIFGNTFYRSYAFGAGDDTGVYWNDKVHYTEKQMIFLAATIGKTLKGKYDYGHKLRSSRSVNIKIPLPITSKGKIDFVFMESFVQEVEREHLQEQEYQNQHEIDAYLGAAGLTNYSLTPQEKKDIKSIPNLCWQTFNVKELFGESTRGKRLKGDDRNPGTLPFVTAGEVNTGISAFISNKVKIFQRNTVTIDMFGSSKYRNYEYGADDHVAVVHTEKLPKLAAIFVAVACHKVAHTGEFNYGHNFYAKDADELSIMLPAKNGAPDIKTMEAIIRTTQKLVINDVAKSSNLRLTTMEKVVNR